MLLMTFFENVVKKNSERFNSQLNNNSPLQYLHYNGNLNFKS